MMLHWMAGTGHETCIHLSPFVISRTNTVLNFGFSNFLTNIAMQKHMMKTVRYIVEVSEICDNVSIGYDVVIGASVDNV